MSGDLGDFFSLIGKAKQEKEDEFRSLVGEIDIDSIFAETKKSLKEDKKKKKKIEKQAKALEAWLYTETPEKTNIEEQNLDGQSQLLKIVKDITSKGFVRNNYKKNLVDLSDVKISLKGKK